MKRLFLLFLIVCNCMIHFVSADNYHFQEGFASSSPAGWVRQCNSTTSLNHTGLSFSGAYAMKFDLTGSGRYGKNLISPQVTGADTLSFYVSKNANATYMTLMVGKVIGSDTTIIASYDAFNFPNKSSLPGFTRIAVPLKDSVNSFKVIFYALVSTDPAKVNLGWFVVDDIELTKYTKTSPVPVPTSVSKISTNLNDGTWGTVASTSYASGSYPSSTINGFNLNNAFLYIGSMSCPTGETHTNRIALDRSSYGSAVEFPALTTVGEVEIHAVTGTAGFSFRLDEWVNNAWQNVGTYVTRKTPDSVYVIPLARNTETKLRIANNSSSGLYIYKIVTRTLQETLDLSLVSSSPTENEICFSNLKKSITLTFNKPLVAQLGTIMLNGVEIPFSSCVVSGKVVTIPVTLSALTTGYKNFTFTVSAGSFAEDGNLSNLSKAITINFQTIKTVAYPSNYNAQIDVVYKNVNSTNCRMDIYYPTDAPKPVPVIINMHGGGWVSGFKEEQGGFTPYFNRGYAVANVEYRMRNEKLAPAAVEDVRGAMIYLLNHAQELNIDKNKIVFQGGSAGGHLALISGYLRHHKIYDNDCEPYNGDFNIMAVIDKYGAADLKTFAPVYPGMVAWLGANATDTAFVNSLSPMYYVDANTPPTYIIHGDSDPTIPYSQSVALQAALQKAGVKNKFTTVPGGLHGGFPDAYNTQMETEVDAFLTEVIAQIDLTSRLNAGVRNAAIRLIQTNAEVQLSTDQDVVTRVYTTAGKELLKTTAKSFKIDQKGFFLLKVQCATGESLYKIMVK